MRALTTPRIALEPLSVEHAALLAGGFAEPALYEWIDAPSPDLGSLTHRFARITVPGADAPDRWLNWAMRLRGTGDYPGLVEITLHPDLTAHLAYFVFRAFTRRGLGREGCAAVIEALRADCGVVEVIATMDTRNVASKALAESLGFVREEQLLPSSLRGEATLDYRYRLRLD